MPVQMENSFKTKTSCQEDPKHSAAGAVALTKPATLTMIIGLGPSGETPLLTTEKEHLVMTVPGINGYTFTYDSFSPYFGTWCLSTHSCQLTI